jgi:molybdopterin-containing oxidoreductase family membrane subunit
MATSVSSPVTETPTVPSPFTAEQEAYALKRMTRAPLVSNNRSFNWVTEKICGIVEAKTPLWWWCAFIPCAGLASITFLCFAYLIATGVGVWGSNSPVFWAWDITNFVFWIGIGHAGTLISAILFLTRQKWRTSINRASEAMTLFAVVCAGLFPALHVGRVWMAWMLAPVPQANAIWPNFRSPLLWDVFAVSTYFTVSVLFWFVGLIPDLATLRDRAKEGSLRKYIYAVFALGWRGSNRQWQHYEMAYLILAGISTPLVLSVHSVVSFDFATSQLPGWHTTIFPPYFVAGAIFGGFAMVLTILIPARVIFKLEDLITDDHIDKMAKVVVLTGSIVGYAYLMELFIAWYGANPNEKWVFFRNRIADPYIFGPLMGVPAAPYWWAYWSMMSCNVIFPQFFWSRTIRRNLFWCWLLVQPPNIGMWFERFVIIATSLHRDFLPSSWGYFIPTWVDKWTYIGTFGLFLALFLLFIRFLPMIAIAEVKSVMPDADPHKH